MVSLEPKTMSPIGPPIKGANGRTQAPGFTLIELILVMALLIIVIAAVAPALSQFFHGRNLDSEARRLLSLTRLAQSRAVSEGTPMRVWFDSANHTYGVLGEYGGSTADNSEKIFQLDADLAIDVVQDTRNRISSPSRAPVRAKAGMARDGSSTAVGIRFLADGTVDESSPDQIRLYEDPSRRPATSGAKGDNHEVWITTDAFRLRYEIATNIPSAKRR